MLRAYARHMRQNAAFTFSLAYMEQTLAAYPQFARRCCSASARFDPARSRAIASSVATQVAIRPRLDQVPASTRTASCASFSPSCGGPAHQLVPARRDGASKPYLSFKFPPSKSRGPAATAPMFEIFVISPRFEGVHLRGGKVARGGCAGRTGGGLPHRGPRAW